MAQICVSCQNAAKMRRLFTANDPVTGDEFNVECCAICGLVRTDPQPSLDGLDRYYPSGYHSATKRYLFGLDRGLSLVHRPRIRRMERLIGGPGRALDVGCGPGWFLAHMRERGWHTRGTERNANAARQAREGLDLDVRAQDLDDVVAESVRFDAVVLWHVAEHMSDPSATMRDIAKLLRPGGVVMISVPNFGSLEARIGKDRWFHLDVPRHLYHFTPATLKNLLVEAGLVPCKEVHVAPEYDIFSFVQTAQNRMGLPVNLLYDVLRRKQARLAHPGVRSVLSVLAVTTAVPLTLAGLVWTPVAATMGWSATITVYAQRPLEAPTD